MASDKSRHEKSDMLTSQLVSLLFSEGAAITGVADLSEVAGYPFPDLPVAVSIAYPLNQAVVREISKGPTEEYICEYARVNQELSRLANTCVLYLCDQGFRALAVEPTPLQVDRKHLYDVFPHKTAATRAGIGWIGKCALLVTRTLGSAIRLVTVCTNAPLEPGEPVIHSYCGDCTICTVSCPANASLGINWNPALRRDQFWDADACFLQCEEAQKTSEISAQVCGICISVCPYTGRFVQGSI